MARKFEVLSYSKSGFVRMAATVRFPFEVQAEAIRGRGNLGPGITYWKSIAGFYEKADAVEFMRTYSGEAGAAA